MCGEEIQKKTKFNDDELKSIIMRIFNDKRNKYVLYEQQTDVEKLVRFVINIRQEETKVPYNILIVSDDTQKSEELCENINRVAERIGIFEKSVAGCDINDWYHMDKTFEKMANVYSCIVFRNVTSDSIKNEKWKQMVAMMRSDQTAELIKIMCVTREAAKLLKAEYEDIYYRYFADDYHIWLKSDEIPAESIYKVFLQKLEVENYRIQDEFSKGIESYIKTVYPKASEREMSFINDLYDRVIRAAFIRKITSREIDKDCIPNYKKEVVIKEEYPSSRAFRDSENAEENVLFFNLSVLGGKCIMSKYCGKCQEETINYTGISQLEAGTKHILYTLAKEDKKLNRIVMVESKQTRTDDRKEFVESFWDNPEEMKKYYRSSVCFYKQRIKDYLRRNESKEIFENIEDTHFEENKTFEFPFPDTVEYTEDEINTLFYDIPTYVTEKEEKDCYEDQSLQLFAEITHGIRGEAGKTINLYIDMQGGFRSAVSQIDAVLELLKDRNVNIKGRYAIKGFRPDGKTINEVGLVDQEYKAYELVSAMTEFKRYGRGQGLTEFFADAQGTETRKITEVISKISDAIALCNVEEFEKQITQLRKIKGSPEIQELLKEKNSQISIVFQDITDDYGPLLESETTTFAIVKWCVNKAFYQQAITLIESLMPKMWIECGILHYDPDDEVQVTKENGSVVKKKISDACENTKNNLTWKKTENKLFEQWSHCNSNERKKEYFGVSGEEIKEICKKDKLVADAHKFSGSNPTEWKNEFKYEKFNESLNKNPNRYLFWAFAALSKLIKETRNGINHASTDESYESVEHMLEAYVKLGDHLKLDKSYNKTEKIQKTAESSKQETRSPKPDNNSEKVESTLSPGTKVQFTIEERSKNNGRSLRGTITGGYKGVIQKNCLKDLSIPQLEKMCGQIVEAEVERVNEGIYMLKYTPTDEKDAFSYSLKDKIPQLN